MGFFQKAKQTIKHKDELPEYVESLLENSNAISNEEIDERFSVKNMALSVNYGIDHAIQLLRALPDDNTDIVVSVVTKTLESANIDVSKIIQDAESKAKSLEAQVLQLNEEIKALQDLITQKKDQINISTEILGETQKVKGLLESARHKVEQPRNMEVVRNYPAKSAKNTQPEQDTGNLSLHAHSV